MMPPVKRDVRKQTVRFPPDLWALLRAEAERNRRTVNMQIVVIVEAALRAPPMRWDPRNGPAGVTPPGAALLYPAVGNPSLDEDYLPGNGVD